MRFRQVFPSLHDPGWHQPDGEETMGTRAILAVAVLGLAVVSPLVATFDAEANKVGDFRDVCKKVVVAPMECPPDLNCLRLETDLVALLRVHAGLQVIGAAAVRKALFDLGLSTDAPDLRERMLDHFEADAIVVAGVPGFEVQSKGATAVWTGTTMIAAPNERKIGATTLAVIGRDGRKLLEGSAQGSSKNPYRTEQGFVAKMFRLILEKAFK